MSPALRTRQNDGEVILVDEDPFYYSPTANIVKWSIVSGIILFTILFFVGGYLHAKRRIRKGLPLMKYHRFLVPVQHRGKPENNFAFYRMQNEGYSMQNMPPPPPVYDPNAPMPPTYQPPEGGSKVAPSQTYDVPPPGPPPGHSSTDTPEAELPPRPAKESSSIVGKASKLIGKFGRK